MDKKKKLTFLLKDVWELDQYEHSHSFYKSIVKELQMLDLELKLFFRNNTLSRASDLAFSTLLSLVPLLATLFMMFKLFGGKEIVDTKLKAYIYGFLTPVSRDQISSYMDSFLSSATVETLGSIGIIFLLVAVFLILSSIETTFNIIWHVKKGRNFAEKLKTYWLIITVSPILVSISITLTTYLDNAKWLKYSLWENFSSILVFKIVPFILIVLFFTLVIKVIPNSKVESKHAIIGALIGTFLYYVTKNLFIDYTKLAVSYNIIYGSIAVLPIFMIWSYWFWIIILFSVETAFVRQNFVYLKKTEKSNEINYYDKIKITLFIGFKLIRDYIESKKSANVLEYSSELDIPLNHVINCFTELEQSGVVKILAKTPEVYIPAIPIREINIKTLLDSVNKMYIPANKYNTSSTISFKGPIENIINDYKRQNKNFNNEIVEELLVKYSNLP